MVHTQVDARARDVREDGEGRGDRLSTGIEVLDERLAGGIDPGSVVLLTAAPASQAELLLAQLASPRRTLYLTTRRSVSAVESALDRSAVDLRDCTVKHVDADRPLAHTLELARQEPEGTTLVVDHLDAFERIDEASFWTFLNDLRDHVEGTDSLAVLYGLDVRRDAPSPTRVAATHVADVVFDLSTDLDGQVLTNRLLVPKVRGGEAVTHAIKLNLDREISVDTSRDIA